LIDIPALDGIADSNNVAKTIINTPRAASNERPDILLDAKVMVSPIRWFQFQISPHRSKTDCTINSGNRFVIESLCHIARG
jgi:hypothetical protein